MDPDKRNIEKTLLEIIPKYLLLKDEGILTMESDLVALGLDFMSTVTLLLDIEETFGIMFADNMLTKENFGSPARIADVLHRIMEERIQ